MKNDNVNGPAHYRQGGIECIEAIKASMSEEGFRDYLKGNVMKYIWNYMSRIDDNNKFRQNWEEMIAAVIESAAKDYVSYYKKLKRVEAKRDEISFTSQSVADFSNKLKLYRKILPVRMV